MVRALTESVLSYTRPHTHLPTYSSCPLSCQAHMSRSHSALTLSFPHPFIRLHHRCGRGYQPHSSRRRGTQSDVFLWADIHRCLFHGETFDCTGQNGTLRTSPLQYKRTVFPTLTSSNKPSLNVPSNFPLTFHSPPSHLFYPSDRC